jgi:hypothetical protein
MLPTLEETLSFYSKVGERPFGTSSNEEDDINRWKSTQNMVQIMNAYAKESKIKIFFTASISIRGKEAPRNQSSPPQILPRVEQQETEQTHPPPNLHRFQDRHEHQARRQSRPAQFVHDPRQNPRPEFRSLCPDHAADPQKRPENNLRDFSSARGHRDRDFAAQVLRQLL